eukprot:COSAG01_NODE_1403_length_10445_cov_67.595399_8_plen_1218_part_01
MQALDRRRIEQLHRLSGTSIDSARHIITMTHHRSRIRQVCDVATWSGSHAQCGDCTALISVSTAGSQNIRHGSKICVDKPESVILDLSAGAASSCADVKAKGLCEPRPPWSRLTTACCKTCFGFPGGSTSGTCSTFCNSVGRKCTGAWVSTWEIPWWAVGRVPVGYSSYLRRRFGDGCTARRQACCGQSFGALEGFAICECGTSSINGGQTSAGAYGLWVKTHPGIAGVAQTSPRYRYYNDAAKTVDLAPRGYSAIFPQDDQGGCNLKPLLIHPNSCQQVGACDNCEGHCNKDSDCKGDLVCFSSPGKVYVPGCTGELSEPDSVRVCILPDLRRNALRFPGSSGAETPCEEIQVCSAATVAMQHYNLYALPGSCDDNIAHSQRFLHGFCYCLFFIILPFLLCCVAHARNMAVAAENILNRWRQTGNMAKLTAALLASQRYCEQGKYVRAASILQHALHAKQQNCPASRGVSAETDCAILYYTLPYSSTCILIVEEIKHQLASISEGVIQNIEAARQLVSENLFQDAIALLESVPQLSLASDLNRSLATTLVEAKGGVAALEFASQKAAEGQSWAGLGLHRQSADAYRAGLAEVPYECAVRTQLLKGLEDTEAELVRQEAVDAVISEASDLLASQEYELAIECLESAVTINGHKPGRNASSNVIEAQIALLHDSSPNRIDQLLETAQSSQHASSLALRNIETARQLVSENLFQDAIALLESVPQLSLASDLNRSLATTLVKAKGGVAALEFASQKAAEGQSWAGLGLHRQSADAYRAGLAEVPYECAVRTQLLKGLEDTEAELVRQEAVDAVISEASDLLASQEYELAVLLLESVLSDEPWLQLESANYSPCFGTEMQGDAETDVETETESSESSDSESESTILHQISDSARNDRGVRAQQLAIVAHNATTTDGAGHVDLTSFQESTLRELLHSAVAQDAARKFLSTVHSVANDHVQSAARARGLLSKAAYQDTINLLRETLFKSPPRNVRDPSLLERMEGDLYQAMRAQHTQTIEARRESLQRQLDVVAADSVQRSKLIESMTKLDEQEAIQQDKIEKAAKAEKMAAESSVSEFQALSHEEKQSAISDARVGVSCIWLREFTASSFGQLAAMGEHLTGEDISMHSGVSKQIIVRFSNGVDMVVPLVDILPACVATASATDAIFSESEHAAILQFIRDQYLRSSRAVWDLLISPQLDGKSYTQALFDANPNEPCLGLAT